MNSVGFSEDFLGTIFLTQVIVDCLRFARNTNDYDVWTPCKEMEQISMVTESMDVMLANAILLLCLYVNLKILLLR